jgi:hypothetical protein
MGGGGNGKSFTCYIARTIFWIVSPKSPLCSTHKFFHLMFVYTKNTNEHQHLHYSFSPEDAPHGEKVREIMRNVISPKSAISYANQNVVFILWLYICLSRGIFHIQQKMIMWGGLISYHGRLTSICLGIMEEFLLVIWQGKGKGRLAAKRAVG